MWRSSSSSSKSGYCVVCLEEPTKGESLRMLPGCRHCFHMACIDAWFQVRRTCPLCRAVAHHPLGGGNRPFLSLLLLLLRWLAYLLDVEVTVSLHPTSSDMSSFPSLVSH